MSDEKRLYEAEIGVVYRISGVNTEGRVGKRLADLGAVKGARISCVGRSPFGDPRAYLLFGSIFAIRNCDAALIKVRGECEGGIYGGEKMR